MTGRDMQDSAHSSQESSPVSPARISHIIARLYMHEQDSKCLLWCATAILWLFVTQKTLTNSASDAYDRHLKSILETKENYSRTFCRQSSHNLPSWHLSHEIHSVYPGPGRVLGMRNIHMRSLLVDWQNHVTSRKLFSLSLKKKSHTSAT